MMDIPFGLCGTPAVHVECTAGVLYDSLNGNGEAERWNWRSNIVELGDEKMWGDEAQPRGVDGDPLPNT